ncbi:MAG: hypothetical protein WC518_02495 [Patescibacteria group bacterium]
MRKIFVLLGLLLLPGLCLAQVSSFNRVQSPSTLTNLNLNSNLNSNLNVTQPSSNSLQVPTNLNVNIGVDDVTDDATQDNNANSETNNNISNLNTRNLTNTNINSEDSAPSQLAAPQSIDTKIDDAAKLDPAAIKTILITDPKGGETYELNGQTRTIYFKYFGYSSAKDGKLQFQVFLLQNGKELGPVAGIYPYDASVDRGYDSLGYKVGWYTDLAQKKEVEIVAGSGFTLKVKLLRGGSVIASAESSEFSFAAGQDTLPPLSLKVMSPNGGETFIKDAKVLSGYYTYAGLDPDTLGGAYTSRIELWRNGKLLGNLYNTDFSQNPSQGESNFGWTSGIYWDEVAKTNKLADSGSGYRIKVTIFKDGKSLISDQSDGAFAYVDGPAYTGTPAAKIVTPNGGEKFYLGKSAALEFSFTGFDHYDGGKITYVTTVYKGGEKIGTLFPDWMHTTVNLWQDSETVYTTIDDYYDLTGKKMSLVPGTDYQLGIEVSKLDKVILTDLSDGKFTIAKEGKVVSLLNGMRGTEVKVVAPVELESALYGIAKTDPNVKSIKVDNNRVEVKYQQEAKLFGFILIKYKMRINADLEKKQVSAQKPWWLFLTSNKAKEALQSSQAALNSWQNELDQLGEMSEERMQKLNQLMGQKQKIEQTLSNIIKKVATTTEAITQNIK